MNWINVKDQLPPIDEPILAYAREFREKEFKIIKCIYCDKFEMKGRKPQYKFYEDCGCSGYECDYINIEEVTHWMPLPKLPKDTK